MQCRTRWRLAHRLDCPQSLDKFALRTPYPRFFNEFPFEIEHKPGNSRVKFAQGRLVLVKICGLRLTNNSELHTVAFFAKQSCQFRASL